MTFHWFESRKKIETIFKIKLFQFQNFSFQNYKFQTNKQTKKIQTTNTGHLSFLEKWMPHLFFFNFIWCSYGNHVFVQRYFRHYIWDNKHGLFFFVSVVSVWLLHDQDIIIIIIDGPIFKDGFYCCCCCCRRLQQQQ